MRMWNDVTKKNLKAGNCRKIIENQQGRIETKRLGCSMIRNEATRKKLES